MNSLSSLAKRGAVLTALSLALAQTVWAQSDPPARVGRLDFTEGQASIANSGNAEWLPANSNQPLLAGDTLFIHPGARAEMHLGSHALRINGNSALQILAIDDEQAQVQLNQGSVVLRVRRLYPGERVELVTANLRLQIVEAGEYKISYYDNLSTTVAVRQGSAIASANGNSVSLYQGQQTNFFDTDLKHSRISSLGYLDDFDQWAMVRDQAEENSVSARYIPRDMPGYQQLDAYGAWENHSEYGAVWYPQRVQDDWAPYRDGKWVWIAPWGWTWVDAAPWGFAPFHYGRWVYAVTLSGRRWCWVPGRYPAHVRPVYAPALVVFVGNSNRLVVKGAYSPNYVSWFPLGPGEVYRPGYHYSQNYWQNLNHGGWYGRNQGIPERRPTTISYLNQHIPHAVTTIEQQNFVRGDSVFNMTRIIKSVPLNSNQNLSNSVQLQPDNRNRFGQNYQAEIVRDRQGGGMNRATMNLQAPNVVPGRSDFAGGNAAPLNTRQPAGGVTESRPESRLESRQPLPVQSGLNVPARGNEIRPDAVPQTLNPARTQGYQAAQPDYSGNAATAPGTTVNQPVYNAPRSLPVPLERNEGRFTSPSVNNGSSTQPAQSPGWIRQAVPESQREPVRNEYKPQANPVSEYRRDAATPARSEPRYETPRIESPRQESRSLNVAEPRREVSRPESRPESRTELRSESRRESVVPTVRSEPVRNEKNEAHAPRSEKEAERRR